MTIKKNVKVEMKNEFPFGAAVAQFKSVGEEEVVSLAGDKILRNWQKQIRTAKSNIDKAVNAYNDGEEDRAQELKEKNDNYFDSFLDVDSSTVKTVEQREAFVSKYEQNVSNKYNDLTKYQKKLLLTTDNFNTYVEEQTEIIDRYEMFIKDRQNAIERRLNK